MRIETAQIIRDQVIAALDVDTLEDALALVERLDGRVRRFKIGSRLFTLYGPQILDRLGDRGAEIFLDLKFHDIPSVIHQACKHGAAHEAVFMMTVHASGGRAMLEAAVEGAAAGRHSPPAVIAVTALTSLSPDDVTSLGIATSLAEWAGRLAGLTVECGLDGLVCSPLEARTFRDRFGPDIKLVTPGIRLSTPGAGDDQVRVMTPGKALAAGSSYLVIGRPIYEAEDPIAAVEAIGRSIDEEH
ncbi:MAG: orotidine-5'-phosphate decarboxylase [Bradymonadaceae bacterium]